MCRVPSHDRDVVEKQPNKSSDAASHLKDSRPAREEIEGIVNGLTRFDHGLQVSESE